MSDWQPIETAPTEGSFLVFGRWPDDADEYYAGKPWWQFGMGHENGPYGSWDDDNEPTHWQPLCEPEQAA